MASERFYRTKVKRPAERMVEMLDHIEKRVELLREHALSMVQEKEALVSMLQGLNQNEDLVLLSEGLSFGFTNDCQVQTFKITFM